MVPGKDETLRINGPAVLTTARGVLDRTHPALRRPKMALVVEAEEVFAHCAKAFRRGRVWQPDSWAALADAPDLAEIFACQTNGDAAAYRDAVAQSYEASLAAD